MITHLSQILDNAVTCTPDAPAVVLQGRTLSYRELEERVGRIAAGLARLGAGPGRRVALWLDRSIEQLVAVLAVLKTGTAYVPLPARAPYARIHALLDDADVIGLVTAQARAAGLHAARPRWLILADAAPSGRPGDGSVFSLAALESARDVTPSPESGCADDPAYLLYTSGSTGTPKAVVVSHRAALNFVEWASEAFGLRPGDRVLNQAPLTFDLSVFELFATLRSGAAVLPVPEPITLFPAHLARFASENDATVWYGVPSSFVQLEQSGGFDRLAFPHLRLVLFAGEVFPLPPLRRLMEQLPGARFYNLYGPTETNVCTCYAVSAPPEAPLPIGQACAGHEIVVVDAEGRAVSDGVEGELCVCGPSVMSGYWNRPEATAAAFLSLNGRSFYRTGDRVCRTPEGTFHFLGRLDRMIKSRGYRIEPGEVEAVLYRHPEVVEAAVVPVLDERFGTLLKAVLVTRTGGTLTARRLAAHCAEYLPPYMIPAYFESRQGLPRTTSGKIDRLHV